MDALAHTAVLALGSNLGESETTLEQAAADLVHLSGGAVRLVGASGLYVTEPVGGPADQPDYINAILEVHTSLDPYALLALCQQVEAHHHRVRLVRWGPRTLDIDVITYDDLVSDDPALTLPHPRAHERAFVLVPWEQANPQAQLMVRTASGWANRAVAELACEVSAADSHANVNAVKLLRPMNFMPEEA
ncbi:2-amino-4-hydroxy-6-hydroxymethyldihydropteridine diphosphokinase [Rothia aeria]|nr:2-amino-4-hydroxy-6-hydroxymethyldihydropteridine diphosphokinase [Rothia aeria]